MKIKTLILTVCFLFLVRVDVLAGDFTDHGNKTVTDANTGLMWQQGEGGEKTWEDAIAYCEGLSLAVYTDWRLPNKEELKSITDDTLNNPAIDTNFFPDAHASNYWSSSSVASLSSSAWYVSFSSGLVGYYGGLHQYYVRCVRAGQ